MTHSTHSHGHGSSAGKDSRSLKRLVLVLLLTASITVVELIGGLFTGSLALLADTGHMLSDVLSLALAVAAVWISRFPPTPQRSFGYRRAEILAALINGITLVVIAIWIFYEAYERFVDPPKILGGWMLLIAMVGLIANVLSLFILRHDHAHNLNISAAFRHVLADLLGSVGAITAAVVIVFTGWNVADPIISVLIGFLVLLSSWGVLRDTVNILMEATPEGLNAEEILQKMTSQQGILNVHDLHIWTITTGFPALTAHVLVETGENLQIQRRNLEKMLHEEYGIEHTTLQVDYSDNCNPTGNAGCHYADH